MSDEAIAAGIHFVGAADFGFLLKAKEGKVTLSELKRFPFPFPCPVKWRPIVRGKNGNSVDPVFRFRVGKRTA